MPNTATILAVDDDRLVLSTLAQGLRQAGYRVETAESVDAALASCDASRPDLVILDARMPGRSGLDAARLLRERDIPFLFLSAYDDPELVSEALDQEALGYLVKPLDVPKLVPSIQAALKLSATLRKLRSTETQLSTALAGERHTSVGIGLLMERFRIGHKEAFEMLRSQARSQRRRLDELAQELVQSVDQLNRLGGNLDSGRQSR